MVSKEMLMGEGSSLFINSTTIKIIFFAFELQTTIDWLDKSFKDVWQNVILKVKNENLLVHAEISRVQCISMATYERTFLVQNCIKNEA